MEREVFELTNKERIKHGLKPLVWDSLLAHAARQHSKEMAEKNYFSHASPVESLKTPQKRAFLAGFPYLPVGENIYFAKNYRAPEVAPGAVKDWMNSPPHRKNILSPEFNRLGVGIWFDSVNATYYVTQVFGGKRVEIKSMCVELKMGYVLSIWMERPDWAVFVDDVLQVSGSGTVAEIPLLPGNHKVEVGYGGGKGRPYTIETEIFVGEELTYRGKEIRAILRKEWVYVLEGETEKECALKSGDLFYTALPVSFSVPVEKGKIEVFVKEGKSFRGVASFSFNGKKFTPP